jgi:hypothetical protein
MRAGYMQIKDHAWLLVSANAVLIMMRYSTSMHSVDMYRQCCQAWLASSLETCVLCIMGRLCCISVDAFSSQCPVSVVAERYASSVANHRMRHLKSGSHTES